MYSISAGHWSAGLGPDPTRSERSRNVLTMLLKYKADTNARRISTLHPYNALDMCIVEALSLRTNKTWPEVSPSDEEYRQLINLFLSHGAQTYGIPHIFTNPLLTHDEHNLQTFSQQAIAHSILRSLTDCVQRTISNVEPDWEVAHSLRIVFNCYWAQFPAYPENG